MFHMFRIMEHTKGVPIFAGCHLDSCIINLKQHPLLFQKASQTVTSPRTSRPAVPNIWAKTHICPISYSFIFGTASVILQKLFAPPY